MSILALQNEVEVELTHKCNWHCPYCAINVHSLPEITHEQALAKLMKIGDGKNVTISGGEPGLIERCNMLIYIDILVKKHCSLYLNTNGTFLYRYPDLIRRFKQVIYHCSEDLYLDIPVFIDHTFNNIDYMIIVNDGNIARLGDFLNKYDGIRFSIVEATYNKPGDGPVLSKKNKHMIMTKYANRMTQDSIKRMIREKDFDKIQFL